MDGGDVAGHHVCAMGPKASCRSGGIRSIGQVGVPDWVKVTNPDAPAVRRIPGL
jgi:hypothetical protein